MYLYKHACTKSVPNGFLYYYELKIVPKYSKSTPKCTILVYDQKCHFWEYFLILGKFCLFGNELSKNGRN